MLGIFEGEMSLSQLHQLWGKGQVQKSHLVNSLTHLNMIDLLLQTLHYPRHLPPSLPPPEIDKQSKQDTITTPVNKSDKPDVPPKPISSRTRSRTRPEMPHGVSSEMESDDYHGVSKLLAKGAAKINKGRLALELQDRNKSYSYLSESDEDISSQTTQARPYNDGEVSLRAVVSSDSSSFRSKSPSGDVYLTPTQPTERSKEQVLSSQAQSIDSKRYIEEKVRQWPGSGTHVDGRYYSYANYGGTDEKPIEDAIVFHPPARKFVRIRGESTQDCCSYANYLGPTRNFRTVPVLHLLRSYR